MHGDDKQRVLVYIAGVLTGLDEDKANEYKQMYEGTARICEDLGFMAYLPHKHTDPIEHPLISATEVYITDTSKVKESRLVVAFIEVPSHGVGTELAIAAEYGKYIILINRLGIPVSRMVFGNPSVIGVVNYRNWKQAAELLRQMLISRSDVLNIPKEISKYYAADGSGWLKFILPKTYNDGIKVSDNEFATLEMTLNERFGGYTFVEGHGSWVDTKGIKYNEEHRRYELFVKEFSRYEFSELKDTLTTRFKQITILMTWTKSELL